MVDAGTVVSVDGHRLKLTNLDKVLYPETGTTKGEVIEYYAAVAEWLIPHAADRACTRKRWVHGVGTDAKPGSMFFQKNLDQGTPSWVKRRSIEHREHDNVYPLVNDAATIVWLAQIAALELHVPQWRFGRNGARRNPDRLVLDLDPGDGAGLPECVEVAKLARAILRDVGLDPMPVTSGSKGIHLYAALDGTQTSDQASAFAKELARALEADHPDLVVSDMKKALRGGKVLVDWSQNNAAKTTIVPYSLRGRSRPTVAAPRTWQELGRNDLAQLEFGEVLARLRRRGDPMGDLRGGHLDEDSTLGEYRAKRDPTKTPEPFGDRSDYRVKAHAAAHAQPDSEPIFVIHEHHASSLHWDFRLERDGALVSWAVPKGPPTDPARNNLAVHVEDHPLDYATFEGDIPKGEYGAGHVDIWDTGTYETEKWRDGTEVIVTLHGDREPARYALIHTRDEQWLLHLMKPDGTSAPSRGADRSRADRLRRSGKTVVGSRKQNVGVTPMLATSAAEADIPADERDEWAYEMKWDGVRAVVSVRDGAVDARSRNGLDLTPTFPELQSLADALDGDGVVDGEIVALDPSGRPSFGLLQQRLGLTGERDVASAARRVPARYFAFDLLELGGDDLTRTSYEERRTALEAALHAVDAIELPPDAGDDLEAALRTSRTLGLEGVMAKRRDSVYRVGRRSRDWLKLKHSLAQEVVIAGWRPGTGRRESTIGSLLLGVPDDSGSGGSVLRYVGRVGSGFTERDLDGLRERLERMSRKTSPLEDVPREDAKDARWITPSLVGEVSYGERTGEGRLRHPVWRGWRPDKSADEVRWE